MPLHGGRASTTTVSSMLECTWQNTLYLPMMSNVCSYTEPGARTVESKASMYVPSAVHVPLLVALCCIPSHVNTTRSPAATVSVTLDTLVDHGKGHVAGCVKQGVVDVKSVGLGEVSVKVVVLDGFVAAVLLVVVVVVVTVVSTGLDVVIVTVLSVGLGVGCVLLQGDASTVTVRSIPAWITHLT